MTRFADRFAMMSRGASAHFADASSSCANSIAIIVDAILASIFVVIGRLSLVLLVLVGLVVLAVLLVGKEPAMTSEARMPA